MQLRQPESVIAFIEGPAGPKGEWRRVRTEIIIPLTEEETEI